MQRLSALLVVLLFLCIQGKAQTGNEQLYIQRLASLKSPVDLTYHPEVKKYIDAYLENPEKTREIIGLSKIYFPMIEKQLKAKNIPIDIKYLAVALSDLDPSAQNVSGASGMWMMAYNVSKMYKLKVNSFVDERREPNSSSMVAAAHFKDLYSIYRQWPLVIASYACSPVMLNKCIRMASNSMYFWDLHQYIPEVTRDVYPRFIAAAYILNFYREHNISPVYPNLYTETDSVLVNKWLSFQQISSTLDIPVEQLRKLNPVFKKDVIPYNLNGYLIRLPKSKGKMFELLKDSVYKPLPSPTEFVPVVIQQIPVDTSVKSTPVIGAAPVTQEVKPVAATKPEKKFDKKRVYYTVKKGDILADISDWFDVTPAEIKSWNKLKSDKLIRGKKLEVWIKSSKTGYYKRINTMNPAQKKKLKKKD